MSEWVREDLRDLSTTPTVAGVAYLVVVVAVGVGFGWYPSVADLLPSGSPFVDVLPTLAGTLGVFLVAAVPAYLYGRADLVAPAAAPIVLFALIAYTANPESYAVLVFFYPPLVVAGAVVLGAIEYGVRSVTVG